MDRDEIRWVFVGIFLFGIFIFVMVAFGFIKFSPEARAIWNAHMGEVQQADDATRYETLKSVEDTCRSMISSYESDKVTYESYKSSDSAEQRSWAEQAKIRANKTAITYNNYILKNRHIWVSGVPDDIREELGVIE